MATEVFMPKLSMTMETGTVLQWFKQEGDSVQEGDLLLEVMTDKINIEVEAYASGTLLKVYYGKDEVVPVNQVIGYIGGSGEQVPDAPPVPDSTQGAASSGAAGQHDADAENGEQETAELETADSHSGAKVRATPAARKAARELGVDLQQVNGSGTNGRIHRQDVEAHAASTPKQPTATPLAKKLAEAEGIQLSALTGSGANGKIVKDDVLQAKRANGPSPITAAGGERIRLEGMRKVIAQRMVQSAFTAPHVTLVTDVDMSQSIEMRHKLLPLIEKQAGVRLSYTEIIMKAVSHALALHPQVNASLEGDYIVQKNQVNIGLAVAVPNGLVVPVVKATEQKGLAELTADCKRLAALARENRLLPDHMSGGTFTISNLGMYAIDAFTPIINQPESAILGVGRIVEKPVGVGGTIALRPMMTLSLSFDHRIIDGAPAAAFLQDVKETLENPYRILV